MSDTQEFACTAKQLMIQQTYWFCAFAKQARNSRQATV